MNYFLKLAMTTGDNLGSDLVLAKQGNILECNKPQKAMGTKAMVCYHHLKLSSRRSAAGLQFRNAVH
ncbi:hypothetical protein M514_17326 [Trichuris suis]|uniref:Uncharacterized protein n=1 Tax=Trichuris suis TaxID=68888 RepID=A0A085NM37_9BILA|nr:hypothetical protein M514_17326 [Trichuris suis]